MTSVAEQVAKRARTSKRCIIFRVLGGARNDPKSRSFAFETDADRVGFVDYFTGRLANFIEYVLRRWV